MRQLLLMSTCFLNELLGLQFPLVLTICMLVHHCAPCIPWQSCLSSVQDQTWDQAKCTCVSQVKPNFLSQLKAFRRSSELEISPFGELELKLSGAELALIWVKCTLTLSLMHQVRSFWVCPSSRAKWNIHVQNKHLLNSFWSSSDAFNCKEQQPCRRFCRLLLSLAAAAVAVVAKMPLSSMICLLTGTWTSFSSFEMKFDWSMNVQALTIPHQLCHHVLSYPICACIVLLIQVCQIACHVWHQDNPHLLMMHLLQTTCCCCCCCC